MLLLELPLVIIIFLSNLLLGFLVYFMKRRENFHIYFFFITIFTNLFIVSAYLSEWFPITNPFLSLFLSRITFVGVVWWVIFLFIFSLSFPEGKKIDLRIISFLLSLGIVLTILFYFSPSMIRNISIQLSGFDIVYGELFLTLFGIFFFILVFLFLLSILKKYFTFSKLTPLEKIALNIFISV